MPNIAILGAGIAGLSTAYHLKSGYVLFEKENEVGGVCRSLSRGGYTFDTTGHVLHFCTPEVANFVNQLLDGEWSETERSAWVYTKEKYIPYPFQAHFTQLSDPIRQECLSDFIEAQQNGRVPNQPIDSFQEWILSHFGAGIANHFLIPYNTKLWGVPPKELGVDGVQKYIPIPTLEEILSGSQRPLGYNARFYYPRQGGIHRVALALSKKLTEPIYLNHEVEQIDLQRRKIRFRNGKEFSYHRLLSTIPLPELGKRIFPIPDNIQQLFGELQWVSVCSFHFGIRALKERHRHWIYFAEPEYPFYRVVLPANYAPHLAPKGNGTLQVEVPFSMERTLTSVTQTRSAVIHGLKQVGLLQDENQIEVEESHIVRYGYAVFTRGCQEIVKTLTKFLGDHSIDLVGRYASWEYMSLEDCILAGREVADSISHNPPPLIQSH